MVKVLPIIVPNVCPLTLCVSVMTLRSQLIRVIKSYGDNTENKHYKENHLISFTNSAYSLAEYKNVNKTHSTIPYHANITHVNELTHDHLVNIILLYKRL